MPAVAEGTVDAAIRNFNPFQDAYETINKSGGDVIFYCPLFICRCVAIMVRSGSDIESLVMSHSGFAGEWCLENDYWLNPVHGVRCRNCPQAASISEPR